MLSTAEQAMLITLINRRGTINDSDSWTTLYQLVVRELASCSPRILKSCVESKKDLVDFFFSFKIYESRLGHSRPIVHCGELRVWFENFLHSQQRRHVARREEPLLENDGEDGDGAHVQRSGTAGSCNHYSLHQAQSALHDLGLVPERLASAAQAFCKTLPAPWLCVIKHHTCEEDAQRLPMSRVAEMMHIHSYHYHARKLGLTGHKSGFFDGFAETTLGKWLASAGIAPARENAHVIGIAFEFLCEAALAMPTRLDQETTA